MHNNWVQAAVSRVAVFMFSIFQFSTSPNRKIIISLVNSFYGAFLCLRNIKSTLRLHAAIRETPSRSSSVWGQDDKIVKSCEDFLMINTLESVYISSSIRSHPKYQISCWNYNLWCEPSKVSLILSSCEQGNEQYMTEMNEKSERQTDDDVKSFHPI